MPNYDDNSEYWKLTESGKLLADNYRRDYIEFKQYMKADCGKTHKHLNKLFETQQKSLDWLMESIQDYKRSIARRALLVDLRNLTTVDDLADWI